MENIFHHQHIAQQFPQLNLQLHSFVHLIVLDINAVSHQFLFINEIIKLTTKTKKTE